jgi:hypothetical protein
MSQRTHGIGWFEISTSDPAAAERFYGGMFGWTFAADDGAESYKIVTTPAEGGIRGGIVDNAGATPNYAVFYVVVEDVEEACRRAEKAGGAVVVPPRDAGGLVLAHLRDPAGNLFAVYTPPAGAPA